MPSNPLSVVFQQLRAASRRTDEELLTDFLIRRDEDALAALVERHAPMVWGVCCRLLRNPHDAEDAFQATFLVLVQKAASVVPRTMLANWLHGVARQTAVRQKATAAKRGWREVPMNPMPEPSVAEDPDEELLSLLDHELSRLPAPFRALIVLCDLEGHTRKDVARQLGCPEGTVASRLARARDLLAKRLVRHGLAVSGGSLAVLSQSATSACAPATVVNSTIKLATLLAAGKAAGVISGSVATLTQGVLQAMLIKKVMTAIAVLLALGVAVITGGSLAVGQTQGKPMVGKPLREKPVQPAAKLEKPEKDPEVAWGQEAKGLQLGVVLVPAYKATFRPGETMEFAVKVRNVSREKIAIRYGIPELAPTITDSKGETVLVIMPPRLAGLVKLTEKVLQPGETVELYKRNVGVKEVLKGDAEQNGRVNDPTIRVGTGKYTIAFPESVQRDLTLTTGGVEFEVKDGSEMELLEKKEPTAPPNMGLRAPVQPGPLAGAAGTNFTFVRVMVTDGMLSWNGEVVSTKAVPVEVTVVEGGVTKNKTVTQTITTAESAKVEKKLADLVITGINGKSVPTDDAAKRLSAGGTIVVLFNPLDDTTRKHFAADTLFYYSNQGKSGPDTLTHQMGMPVSFVVVKANDGLLSWNELTYTLKEVPTEQEKNSQWSRAGYEAKYVAKEMKLAALKITGLKDEVVAAADIEKRLKEGGILVRMDSTLSKEDRKLFHDDCLFLEPPRDEPGRIRISSGPPEVEKGRK